MGDRGHSAAVTFPSSTVTAPLLNYSKNNELPVLSTAANVFLMPSFNTYRQVSPLNYVSVDNPQKTV